MEVFRGALRLQRLCRRSIAQDSKAAVGVLFLPSFVNSHTGFVLQSWELFGSSGLGILENLWRVKGLVDARFVLHLCFDLKVDVQEQILEAGSWSLGGGFFRCKTWLKPSKTPACNIFYDRLWTLLSFITSWKSCIVTSDQLQKDPDCRHGSFCLMAVFVANWGKFDHTQLDSWDSWCL